MSRFPRAAGVLSVLLGVAAFADPGAVRTTYSRSGQFVLRGPVLPALPPLQSPVLPAETNGAAIRLDPNMLAVSCERVKQALLRELALPDLWVGRIQVVINPELAANQPPVIGARVYSDGWQYQFDVPGEIEKPKLLRGLIQVLLLEIANRNAGTRSAQIPLWLSEGLTQHLLHSGESSLILSTPRVNLNQVNLHVDFREGLRPDPLRAVRERLTTHAALSFTRMGEIVPDQLPDESWKTFQACSHLMVNQLLTVNGGRSAMTRMVLLLPRYLNWQTAFMTAFQPLFPRLLDVEKWWAVVLVNFTGLDPMNAWSIQVAVTKLDETVRPSVLVSMGRSDLGRRTRLTLQQIISEWDYLRQRIQLKQVTGQLAAMRARMPIEMIALAEQYRSALETYMEKRDRAGVTRAGPASIPPRPERLARDVVRQLNDLDAKRAAFGTPGTTGVPTTPARPG